MLSGGETIEKWLDVVMFVSNANVSNSDVAKSFERLMTVVRRQDARTRDED